MDEGFDSYFLTRQERHFQRNKENPYPLDLPGTSDWQLLVLNNHKLPCDRYGLNAAYGTSAYSKGAVFLAH
jgi:hypothetical protein